MKELDRRARSSDPAEREARSSSKVSANVKHRASVRIPREAQHMVREGLSGGGQRYPAGAMGPAGVRIHRGAAVDRALDTLGGRGATAGKHVMLSSRAGPGTLAHELRHVEQGVQGLHLDDPPQAAPIEVLREIDIGMPEAMGVAVRIRRPSLLHPAGEPGTERDYVVQYPVLGSDILAYYAVPRASVFATSDEALWPTSNADGTGGVVGLSSVPQVVYSPESTAEARPIEVVSATAEYVITTTYTKFAVGAGATAVVYTEGGVVLVDAGVAHVGGRPVRALADHLMGELEAAVPDGVVREILITHPHSDHINMASRIIESFDVRSIRINAAQFNMTRFSGLSTNLLAARERYLDGVSGELELELRGRRAEWAAERLRARQSSSDSDFERWVESEVAGRRAGAAPLELRVLVPTGGGYALHSGGLGSLSLPSPEVNPQRLSRPTSETLDFAGERGGRLLVLGDPATPELFRDLVNSPENQPSDPVVDGSANSFVIELPSGVHILVLPDQRVGDFEHLAENFRRALTELGQVGPLQVWDVTHHGQIGWTTNASGMRRMMEFLHEFTARPRAGGGVSGDAVVVSVGMSKVDPATVWMLRSMGMEVFFAANGQRVNVIEVVFPNGQRVVGIEGTPYSGSGPDVTLARRSADMMRWFSEAVLTAEGEYDLGTPRSRARAAVKRRLDRLKAQRRLLTTLENTWIA
ncbi:MAG: hypothetical protein ACI9VR_005009, partial [Cognaticolwellia sp.]